MSKAGQRHRHQIVDTYQHTFLKNVFNISYHVQLPKYFAVYGINGESESRNKTQNSQRRAIAHQLLPTHCCKRLKQGR